MLKKASPFCSLFFEFFLKSLLTAVASDPKRTDFARHSNRCAAVGTMEKTRRFPIAKTNEYMAKHFRNPRSKSQPIPIFTASLDCIFRKHTKKNNSTENTFKDVQKNAVQNKIENRRNKPKNGQKAIQGIRTVTAIHKTRKKALNRIKKSHLLCPLLPITIAKRRRSCVTETAKAAT